MLIIVCGLPGSGKTVFAKKLAEGIGAACISSDSVRMDNIPKRTYSREEKDRVYEIMAEEARAAIKEGEEVVLDATFYLEKYRQMMREIPGGAGLRIIECVLDEWLLRKRMENRKAEDTDSEADFEVYLKVKAEYEAIAEKHLVINTDKPLKENLEKAIEWIRNR